MKKKVSLILLSFILLMIAPYAVNAATVPLLSGKTLIFNSGTTTKVTDGNATTYESFDNGSFVEYTFSAPTDLVSLKINASGTGWSYNDLQMLYYNNAGAVISTFSPNANNTNFPKVVNQVKKIRYAAIKPVSFNLIEIEVYGTAPPPDTTPPAVPTGLQATGGNGQAELTWFAVADSDLASYKIYRNGTYLATVSKPTVTYTAIGLTNGTTYTFQVSSVDLTGNESAKTAAVSVKPAAPIDTTPPAAPTGLSAVGEGLKAYVTWSPNTENDLKGYFVWMNAAKVNSGAPITGTSTYVNNLLHGSTYIFNVSAVDESDNESPKSNSVSVIIAGVMSVNFVPNKDSIAVQVTGGKQPFTVLWGSGTDTFNASKYTIENLTPETNYTITVTDADGAAITQVVNTGNLKGFNPPVFPDPSTLFQKMVDNFGTAGTIAIAVILGAVSLGIICILGLWGWRLAKKWLYAAK